MSATTAGVSAASLVLWVFRVDHGVCWCRSLLGSWLNYFVPAESAMRCCLFPPSLLYAYRTTFPCPVFKWHSPCNWLGDLCMVVQIKSHCARSKEGIFTQTKLNLQFEEMQKRLSHILCQRLHPWPHWCTTPRSLPPCSYTPITWEATSSPDAIELPPTPSHLFYHWNKAAVICLDAFLEKDILCTSIALQVSSYEVGISSPKYRFPKARVVLLNVAVSFLNVCLWSVWSISCISDSVHDHNSNILRFLYWMINIL